MKTELSTYVRRVPHGNRAESEATSDEAENVLRQCLACMQDDKKLHSIAEAIEIKLADFKTNDVLELYYNIRKEDRDVGYISKAWDGPGFSLGDVITVKPELVEYFEENQDEILNICATQGIGCGKNWREDDNLEIHLTINIYQDGLTAATLAGAIQTLEYTVVRIKNILFV